MTDEQLCQYIYNRTGIDLNLNNGFIDIHESKELFDKYNLFYENGNLQIIPKNNGIKQPK